MTKIANVQLHTLKTEQLQEELKRRKIIELQKLKQQRSIMQGKLFTLEKKIERIVTLLEESE